MHSNNLLEFASKLLLHSEQGFFCVDWAGLDLLQWCQGAVYRAQAFFMSWIIYQQCNVLFCFFFVLVWFFFQQWLSVQFILIEIFYSSSTYIIIYSLWWLKNALEQNNIWRAEYRPWRFIRFFYVNQYKYKYKEWSHTSFKPVGSVVISMLGFQKARYRSTHGFILLKEKSIRSLLDLCDFWLKVNPNPTEAIYQYISLSSVKVSGKTDGTWTHFFVSLIWP